MRRFGARRRLAERGARPRPRPRERGEGRHRLTDVTHVFTHVTHAMHYIMHCHPAYTCNVGHNSLSSSPMAMTACSGRNPVKSAQASRPTYGVWLKDATDWESETLGEPGVPLSLAGVPAVEGGADAGL